MMLSMSEYVYDPMFWINTVCVIGSVTALHLISGKSNQERNTGFYLTLVIQPLFFFLGMVTGAWALIFLSSWRAYESVRGILNNPTTNFDKDKK